MIFNKDQDYWASVSITDDFFCIDTYSGLGLTARDFLYPSNLLSPDASEEDLGKAILSRLSQSRTITSREERADLLDLIKSKDRYNDWVKNLINSSNYKSRRALFKNMKKCGIHCVNDVVTISPSRHEKLEAWGRTKGDGIEDIILSTNASPEEIGAALRLAIKRCKG